MEAAEQEVISKVVYSGALEAVLEAKVTGEWFHHPLHSEVWHWITEHWTRYGVSPQRDALRTQFPNYDLVKVGEPVEYYIDRLRESHRRDQTLYLLAEADRAAEDEKFNEALGILSSGIVSIAQDTSSTEDFDITEGWEEMLRLYEEIESRDGALLGIPTGFNSLDYMTGGLQPEQFIVLAGPPKAGKSGLLLRLGMTAHEQGYKVLFIGFEMSNDEQRARYHGILAGFNYSLILQGKMTCQHKERLLKAMKKDENYPPFVFVHDVGGATLAAIMAKVQQYKPDLVLIDGVYLMDAEIPGVEPRDTRALGKLSSGLKRLGQLQKVPVVATTQILNHKWSRSGGLTADAVGYTSAFGQDCDLMLGVEPGADDSSDISKLKVLLARNAQRKTMGVRYDWEHGVIEETEEPEEQDVESHGDD